MNRTLQILNLVGVLVLAGLCAAQWQANRASSTVAVDLEKTRLAQEAQLVEKDRMLEGQKADLEQLRLRLAETTVQRDTAQSGLAATTASLAKINVEREALANADKKNKTQLALQTDQFQKELDQWQAAVKARDAALKKAGETVAQLAEDRNATVVKYNMLAKQCAQLGADRNQAVEKFNALVAKYNALAKQVEEANAKAVADAQEAKAAKKKAEDNGAHLNVAP